MWASVKAAFAIIAALSMCACKRSKEPEHKVTGDPWNLPADPDAPPTAPELKKLADSACPKVEAPYLYRVEKDGKVSYVLGTRHASVPLSKFPDSIAQHVQDSRVVVFELAPNEQRAAKRGETNERSLAEQVGSDTWMKYRKLVGRDFAAAVEHRAPHYALIVLVTLYEDHDSRLEHDLEHVANIAHVPMRGLETTSFQRGLLDKYMKLRDLVAAIQYIPDRQRLADDLRKNLSRYCTGTYDESGSDPEDTAELRRAGYSDAEIADRDEEMVFARTRSWVPELEELFAEGRVFVAVGAAHVRGPKGLAALLRARGWSVTRER